MPYLSEISIQATQAYYDALGFSLTPVELHARLVPLGQPLHLPNRQAGPSLGDIVARRDITSTRGPLVKRIRQQKICAQKWTLMLKKALWLQMVPFVRTLFASGSLALGNTDPESDWDVLAIAQAWRLYTARAGLLLASWLMRRLRTKRIRNASDKFCFNHFITTDSLAIQHRSIFTAHTLAWLIPFYDPFSYSSRFRQANHWIERWVASSDKFFVQRAVVPSRILNGIRWAFELVLNTPIGTLVEYMLRTWMQKRITRNPVTHESGGRIVADDREIEFHPHSFEATVLARYNVALTCLGLGQYLEHDSGLTK